MFLDIAIPDKILTVPILAAFAVSIMHFVTLYRLRVSIPLGQMVSAVVAAMSVQWTVARAVGYGIWKESIPFARTAKGGATRKGADFAAFWEAVLAVLLLLSAVLVVLTNDKQIHELNIFAAVLVVQSLPFIAAVGDCRGRRIALQRIRLLAPRRGQGRRDVAAALDGGGRRAGDGADENRLEAAQ